MAKRKYIRLLSLLLSLAMVFTLITTPVNADELEENTAETIEETVTDESAEASEEEIDEEAAEEEIEEEAEDADEEADAASDESSDEEADEAADEESSDSGLSLGSSSDSSDADTADTNEENDLTEDETEAASEEDNTSSVATINGTGYATLVAAVSAASDGDTITITGTVDESSANISFEDKAITIDLNGQTVNVNYIAAYSGATLYIKDSTSTVNVTDDYTVEYNGGSLNTGYGYAVYAELGGKVIMQSGMVSGTYGLRAFGDTTGSAEVASTVQVDGGYIYAQECAVTAQGKGATALINDGVMETADNAVVAGNGTNNSTTKNGGTTITIKGGTLIGHISTSGYVACGIYHPQEGTLTIEGGTIYAEGGCGILMRGGTLNMTGGTIIASETTNSGLTEGAGKVGDSRIVVTASGVVYDYDSNYYDVSNVDIDLSGSVSITAAAEAISVVDTKDAASDSAVTVSGGTYSSDVSEYCSDSCAAVYDSSTGTYSIASGVAAVYDASGNCTGTYSTLTLAAYAVKDGGKIVLLDNVTELTLTYKRDGVSATFDLNGHSITNSATTTYPGSGVLVQAGTLTIEDSVGTGCITAAKQGPVLVTEGTAVINSGTYVNIAQYGAALKVNGASASATVNGGTFNSVSYAVNATQGSLTINDGYFNGRVAAENVAVAGSAVIFVDVSEYKPTVNITGGYFTLVSPADSGNLIVYVKVGSSGKSESESNGVTITGGYYGITDSYKTYSVNRYLMSGYSLDDNTDDETSSAYPMIVEPAAFSIGYYDGDTFVVTGNYNNISSAAASTAATGLNDDESGIKGCVLLNKDFTTDNDYNRGIIIASDADVILDLNGHSVTSTNGVSAINVNAGGTVTIVDSVGGAVVSSNVGQAGVIRNAGGALTIKGGTYKNTNTDAGYTFVIYNAMAYGSTATVSEEDEADIYTKVVDGTFISDNGNIFGITLGSASIEGGCFSGTITGTTTAPVISGGYFTADPSSYTAENYLAIAKTVTIDEVTYSYTVIDGSLGSSSDESKAVSAESISGVGTGKLSVGVSLSNIKSSYSTTEYPTIDLGDGVEYIFAGWFTDADFTTACTSDMWETGEGGDGDSVTYYAMFVDVNALKPVCVFTPASITGSGNAWRFITSCVSMQYSAILFVVDGNETTTNTVYSSSQVGTNYFYPTDFSSASVKVASYGFVESGTAADSYTVKTGWQTQDGTKIYGKTYTFAAPSGATAQTVLSASEN